MRFIKMHGCGNDYVYVDGFEQSLPEDLAGLAKAVSDRHIGIGGDGLIVLLPSNTGDARMRMFNADGSESEMCGNGLRCVAKLAWDQQRVKTPHMRFETGTGVLELDLQFDQSERCIGAAVHMGQPYLQAEDIPVLPRSQEQGFISLSLASSHPDHPLIDGIAVGMGNPHFVHFCDDADAFPVGLVGPELEQNPAFPKRSNIEFVSVLPDSNGIPTLRQRTWERGSGETQACGTGACAVAVAAMLSKRIPLGTVAIHLNGGVLTISWDGEGQVIMQGEAVTVFTGQWPES